MAKYVFWSCYKHGTKKKADSIREMKPQGNSDFFPLYQEMVKRKLYHFHKQDQIHHLSYSKPA